MRGFDVSRSSLYRGTGALNLGRGTLQDRTVFFSAKFQCFAQWSVRTAVRNLRIDGWKFGYRVRLRLSIFAAQLSGISRRKKEREQRRKAKRHACNKAILVPLLSY